MAWLFFFGALFSLPMLIHGLGPFFWDARLAGNWHYHFSQQFWQGELYPRWLSGMNEGLGSPVFFYYPPLPYWITSLLGPLVPKDPVGWRALGISAFLGLSLSGLGCYLWLRELTAKIPALVAGILFMLMPYHLAKDLYHHGVFAEFWAFAWVPFTLYFVDQVFHGQRISVLGLAASYAALIMTHLPTTLIFSPFLIGYVALRWHLAKSGRPMLVTLAGMVLGVGLSAIYLIPAMTMQKYITMEEIRKYHYASSFFFGDFDFKTLNLGGEYKEWLLGLVLATLAGGLSFAFIAQGTATSPKPQIHFWAGAMLGAFFMMLPVSDFVWRLFPVLQVIQFPWRFNTVLCTGAAALMAFGLHALKRPLGLKNLILLQIGYAAVLAWLYFNVAQVLRLHIVPTYDASSASPDTADAPEYRSRDLKISRGEVAQKMGDSTLELSSIVNGTGKTALVRPREIQLNVTAQENCILLLRQFHFAGWTAFVNGQPVITKPSQLDGLIEAIIPPGNHAVSVELLPLWPEKAGRVASGFSFVAFAALSLWFWKIRRLSPKDVKLVPEKVPNQTETGS